jgi:hypothetical protein
MNLNEKKPEIIEKIKYTKMIGGFFGKLVNFLRRINHDDPKHFGPIPKSYGFISPGDVLAFDYVYIDRSGVSKGDYVTVLVVSTDRGHGIFTSTKNNKLLSCFILDTVSDSVLPMVLTNIKDTRKEISYYSLKKSLSSLFGIWNFRTYDLSKIRGLQKINLEKTILDDKIKDLEE